MDSKSSGSMPRDSKGGKAAPGNYGTSQQSGSDKVAQGMVGKCAADR